MLPEKEVDGAPSKFGIAFAPDSISLDVLEPTPIKQLFPEVFFSELKSVQSDRNFFNTEEKKNQQKIIRKKFHNKPFSSIF